MKTNWEFKNLIKQRKKTIELIKPSFLSELFTDRCDEVYFDKQGKFTISLYNYDPEIDGCNCINESSSYHECEPEIIGYITINGYDTIPNYFNQLEKKCGSKNPSYQKEFLTNAFKNFDKINIKWILDNLDWLIKYFKDEPEILVLKIESFQEN